MKKTLTYLRSSVLNSYAQVFFSDHEVFGFLLLAASFTDLRTGAAGLFSTFIAIGAAQLMGLSACGISKGSYTFNSMLTGLAAGTFFESSPAFILLVAIASVLSLLLSAAFSAAGARLKLPFLSLPFIISTWILLSFTRQIHPEILQPRVFLPGTVHAVLSHDFNSSLPPPVILYLRSLALIFFQKSILAGILVSAGLLLWSRIAMLLSIFGFAVGFLLFRIFHGHLPVQDYSLLAFNHILAAIAIGGFYFIPSPSSFLMVILGSCILYLLTSVGALLQLFELPLFSLPFSLAVWLVVAALREKLTWKGLQPVLYQLYSPEKNLYTSLHYRNRFAFYQQPKMSLPFFGEWTVSQGHDGDITHKNEHRHALDFVVTDEHRRTFELPGKKVQEFFCYGLPVLSPADGTVVKVNDGIPDNPVGGNNLQQNWGNLVIIKHADNVYSQLGHLAADSITVKEGAKVRKGEVLGLCGNSGRSPEPHIHMQFQSTPFAGEKTCSLPLHNYLVTNKHAFEYHAFGIPREGEILLTPPPEPQIKNAFSFNAGDTLCFTKETSKTEWLAGHDELDGSYLQDLATGAKAFYTGSEGLFEFTFYRGNRKCLLFEFFIAANRVVFSGQTGLTVKTELQTAICAGSADRIIQDLLAPFYIFSNPVLSSSNKTQPSLVILSSELHTKNKITASYEITIESGRIQTFTVTKNNTCAKYIHT